MTRNTELPAPVCTPDAIQNGVPIEVKPTAAERNDALLGAYGLLRWYARRCCEIGAETEDVAHDAAEAFARTWNPAISPNVRGYCKKLVWTALRCRWRKKQRERRGAVEWAARTPCPEPYRPEEPVIAAHEAARLRGALATLHKSYQELLAARFGLNGAGEKTCEQLAGGLVSRAAVSERIRTALGRVKARLET